MSTQTTKKSVAQLRAEKEQRRVDYDTGCRLAQAVLAAYERTGVVASKFEVRYDEAKAILIQADRACELLQYYEYEPHATVASYGNMLRTKADLHTELGQHTAAMATLRHAADVYLSGQRKGLLKPVDQFYWRQIFDAMGGLYLDTHQLEAAKRCFLRVLKWPGVSVVERMFVLFGLARYHRERKDWGSLIECCNEALTLRRQVREHIGQTEEKLLLLLADAAEAQGYLSRAYKYDELAEETFLDSGVKGFYFSELVSSYRRSALKHMAAGKPQNAVRILADVPKGYGKMLQYSGIPLMELDRLNPHMAALNVLADALVQTGDASYAGRIRADVEETEAILAAYWEGVREEIRRELREQQRAGGPGTGAREGGAETKKKSKAAKRKQQKRKAQQQKKAAEMAEAAAAAAAEWAACGDEVRQEQDDTPQEQQREEEEQEDEEDEEENDEDNQQSLAAAAAALSVMAVSGTKGQGKEEEEEEEECSVCLNAIESNDADNPAGPPLACGHRYHAFCLHFWAERCRIRCIEPTCPYCRSPLQEVGSI